MSTLLRVERALLALDRVREAGEQLKVAESYSLLAEGEARARLAAAQADLTAIALEPGDCAWALGVLGAAGELVAADEATIPTEARRQAARSVPIVLDGSPVETPLRRERHEADIAHGKALTALVAAQRALLAAARGAL